MWRMIGRSLLLPKNRQRKITFPYLHYIYISLYLIYIFKSNVCCARGGYGLRFAESCVLFLHIETFYNKPLEQPVGSKGYSLSAQCIRNWILFTPYSISSDSCTTSDRSMRAELIITIPMREEYMSKRSSAQNAIIIIIISIKIRQHPFGIELSSAACGTTTYHINVLNMYDNRVESLNRWFGPSMCPPVHDDSDDVFKFML